MDNFSTCLLPWLLIEPFSTKMVAQLCKNSKNIYFGILEKLLFLGCINCFIAKKC